MLQTQKFIDYDAIVSYFNANESTCRETAKFFGINKSTVHTILTKKRRNAESLRILAKNKKEAPYRGGQATQQKSLTKRN